MPSFPLERVGHRCVAGWPAVVGATHPNKSSCTCKKRKKQERERSRQSKRAEVRPNQLPLMEGTGDEDRRNAAARPEEADNLALSFLYYFFFLTPASLQRALRLLLSRQHTRTLPHHQELASGPSRLLRYLSTALLCLPCLRPAPRPRGGGQHRAPTAKTRAEHRCCQQPAGRHIAPTSVRDALPKCDPVQRPCHFPGFPNFQPYFPLLLSLFPLSLMGDRALDPSFLFLGLPGPLLAKLLLFSSCFSL